MRTGRRLARDLAFQVLFELELRTYRSRDDVMADRVAAVGEDTAEGVDRRSVDFARHLVDGALEHRADIDDQIHRAAPVFPVEQMPITDRVALEIGVFELLHGRTASVKIIINEAVQLAKTYGGENSGRFVNGVLGTIAEGLTERGGADRGVPLRSHRVDDIGRR